MDIVVGRLREPVAAAEVEVVEHKGVGHPDTICDALAEELCIALCEHFEQHFGAVLHHNVDKALLRGGRSRPCFGGGELVEPIDIYFAGRATLEVAGARVPVGELAEESARRWLRRNLHALDAERHVRIHDLVRAGSTDLVDVYERQRKTGLRLANDTSIGVGWAPATELERIVALASDVLRRMAADPATPHVGEDVKVMGIRAAFGIRLTVACAFVDRHVASLESYAEKRACVAHELATAVQAAARLPVTVDVNAADDFARGSVYLTVTGTSAEAGDDGEVGRGNRVGGLITPCRPMSIEAAAGKNPVTHVGKLYNVLAHEIAADVVARLPSIAEARCMLVSCIGKPVREPALVDVRLARRHGGVDELAPEVEAIVRGRLATLDHVAARLRARAVRLF